MNSRFWGKNKKIIKKSKIVLFIVKLNFYSACASLNLYICLFIDNDKADWNEPEQSNENSG